MTDILARIEAYKRVEIAAAKASACRWPRSSAGAEQASPVRAAFALRSTNESRAGRDRP